MLTSLPYYGGKSALANSQIGPWIADLLGHDPSKSYVEPFAGMAGVLLCRRPVRTEMLNDADENIITWWRAVRDQPKELQRLLDHTPFSRSEFCRSLHLIRQPEITDLTRALAVHVILVQSAQHGLGADSSQWSRCIEPNKGHRTFHNIHPLADRLQNVQLECRDAVTILEATAGTPDCMVYCDPPYATAVTRDYRVQDLDREAMAGVLREHKGRVAVSGYRDEWDCLEWVRTERETLSSANTTRGGSTHTAKTEVLWTNYQPVAVQTELWA